MWDHMVNLRAFLLFGPAIVLWGLGIWVALRSGIDGRSQEGTLQRLTVNASRLLVRLMFCLVGMAVALQLTGYRLEMIW